MTAQRKGKKTMKRVLISDTLSPEGIEILKNTPGLEVDVMTNLTPDELKGVIKDYDGLAIRSATKVRRRSSRRPTTSRSSGGPASASTTSTSTPQASAASSS